MDGRECRSQNNGGNTDLAAVTAMGYDAYFVALEAMKAAGSTAPADILAALPSLEVSGLVCGDVSTMKSETPTRQRHS